MNDNQLTSIMVGALCFLGIQVIIWLLFGLWLIITGRT